MSGAREQQFYHCTPQPASHQHAPPPPAPCLHLTHQVFSPVLPTAHSLNASAARGDTTSQKAVLVVLPGGSFVSNYKPASLSNYFEVPFVLVGRRAKNIQYRTGVPLFSPERARAAAEPPEVHFGTPNHE